MVHREESLPAERFPRNATPARTIAVTSGKGGVGKSNIALNLGLALARNGHSVCLFDGNLGLGNLDLLCGLNGYWNLSHVVSGARTLPEICLQGPEGLHVIPGASGLCDIADCSLGAQQDLLRQLKELEYEHEFLVIDTGTGIHRSVRLFAAAADVALVVTTPEPTAIADAYATIKALSTHDGNLSLEVLVNRADSAEQARDIAARLQRTTETFLHTRVGSAGFLPEDVEVIRAVKKQTPFLSLSPRSPASRAIDQLARRLTNVLSERSRPDMASFFTRLWPGLCRASA